MEFDDILDFCFFFYQKLRMKNGASRQRCFIRMVKFEYTCGNKTIVNLDLKIPVMRLWNKSFWIWMRICILCCQIWMKRICSLVKINLLTLNDNLGLILFWKKCILKKMDLYWTKFERSWMRFLRRIRTRSWTTKLDDYAKARPFAVSSPVSKRLNLTPKNTLPKWSSRLKVPSGHGKIKRTL